MTSRTGQCHCGAVQFEVTLAEGFSTIRRCTCSYCRMRGAVVASAAMGSIRFTRGEDALTSYRFNTGTAQHFFCSRCGIYTHHQRRSNPHLYGVNVACLDGVSPFDFAEVPVVDGVNIRATPGRRPDASARCASIRPSKWDEGKRWAPGPKPWVLFLRLPCRKMLTPRGGHP